VHGGTAQTAQ